MAKTGKNSLPTILKSKNGQRKRTKRQQKLGTRRLSKCYLSHWNFVVKIHLEQYCSRSTNYCLQKNWFLSCLFKSLVFMLGGDLPFLRYAHVKDNRFESPVIATSLQQPPPRSIFRSIYTAAVSGINCLRFLWGMLRTFLFVM